MKAQGTLWLGFLVSLTAAGCGDSRRIEYAVPTLVKSLQDKDPNLRYWAAQSLGSFGPAAEAAVPDLVEALSDEHKMVRMGAAYALGEIGAADALPALGRASNDDSDEEVRAAASHANVQIRTKKKEPARPPEH